MNNVDSLSGLAIVAVMTTNTHVCTDTSNVQTEETTTNTEVNEETDDEMQEEEEEGRSKFMPTQPPYIG